MRYFILFFLSILIANQNRAQNFDLLNIPIYANGEKLNFGNAGGLKNGQFSNIDLNNDGKMDLFVFDRSGNVIMPFLHTGEVGEVKYEYAPEYIADFPTLFVWALLVDFNGDGVEDIFTSSRMWPGSVEVWRGKRENGRLKFDLMRFDFGLRDILQVFISGGYTQVYVSSIDIPAITDIDGDGDLDILSFEADGSYVIYYQNMAKEENLKDDTLKYIRKDICWGKFFESETSEDIKLSADPFGCAKAFGGKVEESGLRHSGSTLLALDMDGDGDKDLILGDLSNHKLTLLMNGGSKADAWMTSSDNNFPSNDVPVNMSIFHGIFFVDVDADGIKDLIVTPNDQSSGETTNHVWHYKNNGTNTNPVFNLQTKNFLIDQMLSLGEGSHPCFADVNADGLMDLIIGGNGYFRSNGKRDYRMFLLLNIGTTENPIYEIADDDYLNFSSFTNDTGRFAPAVGDLDNDGDLDLMVGDFRGHLYYFENFGGKDKPFQFSNLVYPYKNIFVGQNAKPQIIDINRDGLPDLVIGENNNELNYVQNIGTSQNPNFLASMGTLPNTRDFGLFFPPGSDFFSQAGAPFFLNYADDFRMIFGIESGDVRVYKNILNNTYGAFELEYARLGNFHVGKRVTPSLADIDGDGYYEIALGNERGGLSFYNTIFKVDSFSNTKDNFTYSNLQIYPNPSSDVIHFYANELINDVELYDVNGKLIHKTQNNYIDVSQFNAGLYVAKININNIQITRKVSVIH